MEQGAFIEYLAKTRRLVLPSKLLKTEFLTRLETALLSKSTIVVSDYFSKQADAIDEFIDDKELEGFVKNTMNAMEKAITKEGTKTTEDDERMLGYLVSLEENRLDDFVEISGQLYFLSELMSEVGEKRGSLSKIILVPVLLWSFVNMYELIAQTVDRKMYRKLIEMDRSKLTHHTKRFVGIDRESGDHATIGLINLVLSEMVKLPSDNNSIFGNDRKMMRDKISHANTFYDSGQEKIVVVGDRNYSYPEFIGEFYRVFNFLVRWSEVALDAPFKDCASKMKPDMKIFLKSYARIFRMYERTTMKKRFYEVIIELSKKAEEES